MTTSTIRWPARELDVGEERVVRLDKEENAEAALASARNSIAAQIKRAIARAPNDRSSGARSGGAGSPPR